MRTMILALVSLVTSCAPPVDPDAGMDVVVDAGPPTYDQVQAIYTRSCAVGTSACHSAIGMRGGLNMAEGASYASTVNRPSTEVLTTPPMLIVAPGDPDNSFLLRKIDGTFTQVPYCMTNRIDCGERMPMVGGQPLAAREIALIRAWIANGAPGMADH